MKRSSLLILIGIVLVFVAVQGLLLQTFMRDNGIVAARAAFMGESVAVGTPVSGIVRSVRVVEGQRVSRGQPLFIIERQSQQGDDGITAIVAQRSGTIYDVGATADAFVQASQILARIVDTSPQSLYVEAAIPVSPEQLQDIVPFRTATVRGSFLRSTDPIPAVITRVGLYDARTGTVDVRLRLLRMLSSDQHDSLIGLPVEVTVLPENATVPQEPVEPQSVVAGN